MLHNSTGVRVICDYSLQAFASRPAQVGEKLITHNFGKGTSGFAALADVDTKGRNCDTAICLLPGTELSFDEPITSCWDNTPRGTVAVFGQTNKDQKHVHHDQLEFPDGKSLMLTSLRAGLRCTVLQLPAVPQTPQEEAFQKRAEFAG